MKFISTAQDYQGAFGDLIYKIGEVDPQQTVEVTIWGSSKTDVLGIKKFRGQSEFAVNIASYMRKAIEVQPEYASECVVRVPSGRIALGGVRTESLSGVQRLFTGGIRKAAINVPLTDAPLNQSLSPGETDEIALIPRSGVTTFKGVLTNGNTTEQVFEFTAAASALPHTLVVNMDDVARWAASSGSMGRIDAYTHLAVSAVRGAVTTQLRRYELGSANPLALRLCWWNSYGVMDYYTFTKVQNTRIVADKSRVYTQDGYRVYGSSSEKYITLRSGYESAGTLEWLAGVINSPKVWACGNGVFTPVDVLTDRIETDPSQPSAIVLEVRECEKTVYQKV